MPRSIILSAVLLFSFSSLLQAQELRIGVGYNGSNVQKAGDERWAGRAGYQRGIDLVLGERFFLRPGACLQVRNLNCSLAAVNDQGEVVGADVEYRYTSRSLRVPLFAGVRLIETTDDKGFNIYLAAGTKALFDLSPALGNDQLEVETAGTQWFIGGAAGFEIGSLFMEGGYDPAMSDVFSGDRFSTEPRVDQFTAAAGPGSPPANGKGRSTFSNPIHS